MRAPLALRAVLATALPITVAGVVPWMLLGALTPAYIPGWRWLSLVLMLGGLLLLGASVRQFAVQGRGTLVPLDPPVVFVASGPYRVTRNPMYVGVTLWLIGLTILSFDARLGRYTLCVVVAFHLFIVFVEEPSLRRRFGEPYVAYLRHVPRWIGRPSA